MAKPSQPSWFAPPPRPTCRRCGVELYRIASLDAGACDECRAFFARLDEQSRRVNKGAEQLPHAVARRFAVRTGARVGGE